jgi:peptide chain release factor 3
MTWPIGSGKRFKGVYHLYDNVIHLFDAQHGGKIANSIVIDGLDDPQLDTLLADQADELREDVELVQGASSQFDQQAYLEGKQTPVYFGSAINNFGVKELLDSIAAYAPPPQARITEQRVIQPDEETFSGFVFKVQANMDPSHRDRIAFLRVCSGQYSKGMKMHQARLAKQTQVSNAITFQADTRKNTEQAWPGDIIGLHNHGTIQVGDTFSQGEAIKYTGIPFFAPELFRRVVLKDPLRAKALHKGLIQLSEEGATQLFRPLKNNDLILGAIGVLQFDVTAFRLKAEYNVECVYDNIPITFARWVFCDDEKKLEEFKLKAFANLSIDGSNYLVYLAPTRVNLQLMEERWPDIAFKATREV